MMTLTNSTAIQTKAAERFLRKVLRVDAIASVAMGASFHFSAGFRQALEGLPPSLTEPTGVALGLFGATVLFISGWHGMSTTAVWIIIAFNAMWIAGSITLIVAGWLPLTGLGIGFVAVQAAAVALFSALEFIGLRRLQRDAS